MAHILKLCDFVNRPMPPSPWSEGEKIPWHEPDFSSRMLKEHLSQDHDMASRRSEVIDGHIRVLTTFLTGANARVLDLGCGPGLYCQRLASLGHSCTGIDISPASLNYAKQQAADSGLEISYIHQDIRRSGYPQDIDLALMLFGEFNVFTPEDALLILKKAHDALAESGVLLIEPSTFEGIFGLGQTPSIWKALQTGLFCASPHIWLYESFWDEESKTATERHCILFDGSSNVQVYASTSQAYRDRDLIDLVQSAGFKSVELTTWEKLGLASCMPGFQLVVARP